jgi:hypothetical protein
MREGEMYSPARGFEMRSRESTPETPQRRGSPSVRADRRNPSNLRGMTPAYSDDSESRQSSPLAKKAGFGTRSGTAE